MKTVFSLLVGCGLLLASCSAAATPEYSEEELATALVVVAEERTRVAEATRAAEEPTATSTLLPLDSLTPLPTGTGPTDPHGDGVYMVGTDIAQGLWRSTSSERRFCYWARRKYDGIVLSSYYGLPGGEMRVGPDDYEVELDGCGVWVYLGD